MTLFYLYYEKIEQAELLYFINEFIALEYVQNFGGIYKVNDVPVGFKIPDIIDWFAVMLSVLKWAIKSIGSSVMPAFDAPSEWRHFSGS